MIDESELKRLQYEDTPPKEPDWVKPGDRVRIQHHSKKFNGELGTVDSRDGGYVYVFPDCQPENKEYPLELYDCELEKL